MHVLGKFFLGLAIVLAAADTYLVLVLYAHRTKWQQDIEGKQAQLADAEAQQQKTRTEWLDLRNAVDRTEATWGDEWTATNENRVLNAQNGTLAIGAGPQTFPNWPVKEPQAVVPEPSPLAYVFATDADGTSHYIGEFAFAQVGPAQSGVMLTQQPPLPTSITALQQYQSQPLRVRETIPSAWRGMFDEYFARYSVIAQRLDFQQKQLEIQTAQLEKSRTILDQRMAELNGDDQAPEGASEQVVKGLVLTIRDEETTRNAELQTLDELRHDLARKVERLNQVVAENQEIVSGLPGYPASQAKPDPRTASN